MNTIKRVYTENPLIDEIIYESKQILQGIILKDEDRANKAETVKSMKDADLYKDIMCNTVDFERFDYTYDIFMKLPFMTADLAVAYVNKYVPIPDAIKPQLLEFAKQKWISAYQDSNNYYRRLWGKPDVGEVGIKLTPEQMEILPVESYDNNHFVHDSTEGEAALLYRYGIIDQLKEEYPDAKYLDYLGERSIDPYLARLAPKFSILYIPSVESPEVSNKFRDRFEINRVYVLKTIYSEAYKYKSDYYDRFMMIMILLLTMNDMIIYSPEYVISRDLFDLRTIEYIFDACGVEFFPEIPLKYQKRLVKNLNRLIKYKSSNKCLVDIASLFGFDNIELFKYYLMKIPLRDDNGDYRKDTYTDPTTGEEVLNLEANYDLKFLKVPIDGKADDYYADPLAYETYDGLVSDDIYWNGVYTPEYVKHTILEHEFNINISKYISLDTIYSLTELQFEMVYFINMLLYSKVNTDDIRVEVPELSLSKTYKLVDLIILLYSLMYLYNGVNDTIVYDPVRAMAVCGFNFDTDLSELKTYVVNQGYTLEEVGLDKFKNPNPVGIHDWDTLISMYEDNKSVCLKLIDLMNHANDYDEYKLYRTVYDALYVTKLHFDMFTSVSNNNTPPTRYCEYLNLANNELYQIVQECASIDKEEERLLAITKLINYIVEDIYAYLDKDEFRYIFNNIPTVSLDYIRQYLFKVLNFFKSYKVDIIHTNIIYRFDDKLENKVRIIDKMIMKYILTKGDTIGMDDAFRELITLNPKDVVPILEDIKMDITRWVEVYFPDKKVNVDDSWSSILIHLTKSDFVDPDDKILLSHVYTWYDYITSREKMKLQIKMKKDDKVLINDTIYIAKTYK